MALKRLVLQTGIGTDLRGCDYTKAAVRAVRDALHRNSMTIPRALGYPPESMLVEIDVGVARPDEVDAVAIAALIPYGQAAVRVVAGGLDVAADGAAGNSEDDRDDGSGRGHGGDRDVGGGTTVIASAAVVAYLDVDEVLEQGPREEGEAALPEDAVAVPAASARGRRESAA